MGMRWSEQFEKRIEERLAERYVDSLDLSSKYGQNLAVLLRLLDGQEEEYAAIYPRSAVEDVGIGFTPNGDLVFLNQAGEAYDMISRPTFIQVVASYFASYDEVVLAKQTGLRNMTADEKFDTAVAGMQDWMEQRIEKEFTTIAERLIRSIQSAAMLRRR